ncbi:hypothetical protein ACTA71_011895 [Dictyostelium dimigraforme]
MIVNNFFIPKKLFLEKDDFIYLVKGKIIPSSFEKVALSCESPKLNEIIFHNKVKLIYFLDGYKQCINKEMFPSSITDVIFYNIEFVLTNESIPDSIKYMGFKGYKYQITKEIVKPGVTMLAIGGDMGYPLNKQLLEKDTIKTLIFDGNYSFPISNESIVDGLMNLFFGKTKFSLDENSLKISSYEYPLTISKNIYFGEGYKFPIIGKIFPVIPSSLRYLKYNIHIRNICNPITKELFQGLSMNYKVNIGFKYQHKLSVGIIGNYERYISLGDVVHPVSEVFFGTNARFYDGYPHRISPFSYAILMHELVFGNVKYPVTKDIIPLRGVEHLKFESGYDHHLTPDIFENVWSLTLDGIKSNVFKKNSLPKSNCCITSMFLRNLDLPFDLNFFPLGVITKMVLSNVSQKIGTNQLPKSLTSLSLINVKIDPNIKFPNLCYLKVDNIDQELKKDSLPDLKIFDLLCYKFPIYKEIFPNSILHLTLGETINPFTSEMAPKGLQLLITIPDYKFLPFDKDLLKYYVQGNLKEYQT